MIEESFLLPKFANCGNAEIFPWNYSVSGDRGETIFAELDPTAGDTREFAVDDCRMA
jgi:hypothetical protein